jgi:S1-C subfamily serine protease
MKTLRGSRGAWLIGATVAVTALAAASARAQTGVLRSSGTTSPGISSDAPLLPENSLTAPGIPATRTLEIKPRMVAAPSPAPAASPDSEDSESVNEAVSDATGTADDAINTVAMEKELAREAPAEPAANASRPYLGLDAQYIVSHDTPWNPVQGLEVVSVDHGSPAEKAGLRGRSEMTSMGETGATASTLMPPLNLIVMPLLKKSGSLGQSGDLIVAIDDKRVESPTALNDELAGLKPGDTIYLTVTRTIGGKSETVKLPVKLAGTQQAADARGNSGTGPLGIRGRFPQEDGGAVGLSSP